MRKLIFLSLLILVSAGQAQAQCTSALSANGPIFNSAFVPTSSNTGFAAVTLNLNGSTATVSANTIGMTDITDLSLMQGTTAVATFTDQANTFHNGRFTRTLAIDPALAAEIAANPSAFSLSLSGRGGTVTSPLTSSTMPVLNGMLIGPSGGTGNFLFSFGRPINEFGDIPITFDVVSSGIGNDIRSLQLFAPGNPEPLFTLGSNLTATNGRITGTALVNNVFANQLLSNPCGITLAVNTPAGVALSGALTAGQEIFIAVAGSTPGLLGNRWKTDLNLFNASVDAGNGSALVQFIPTGASLASAQSASTVSLPPRGGAATRDITTAMFNGITGIGALRIISSSTVFANARVYDDQTGSGKGTLGQSVPSLTRSQAVRSGVLIGLTNVHSGIAGANSIGAQNARTNIGFFNPNDTPTTLAVELRDGNGTVIGTQVITLGAFMHTQTALAGENGLFTSETSDFAGRSVTFLASAPLFAYASIVDNDSGDASFVLPSVLE